MSTTFSSRSLCRLAVFLYFILPAISLQAQITPSAIEPQVGGETLVPEQPDEDLIDSDSVPDDSAESVVPTNDFALALEAIGLDYLPDDVGLPVATVDGLEGLIRDFVSASDGEILFSSLEQLSGELTSYLRADGFALAQVYIPPQRVENGALVLRVLPGVLESVSVQDSSLYRERTIARKFDSRLNKAVEQQSLESRLLRVNDLPGIVANGSFSAAEKTGHTKLRINVREEDPLEFRARVDNHNVESTGDLRFIVGATANNPLGLRDQLDATFIQTFDSGELTNGSVRYQLYSPDLVHLFGARYSRSDYRTDSASFNVDGDTYIGDVFWRAGWIRSRDFNLSTEASLAIKRAEQRDVRGEGVDKLTVGSLSLFADDVDRRFNGIHALGITYYQGLNSTLGSLGSDGGPGASISALVNPASALSGAFEKWYVSYQRLQLLSRNHSLYLRLAGQFTKDQLHSIEKNNIGGPYSVRSHEIGFASGDRTRFASLAWRINAGTFTDAAVFGEYSWSDVLEFEVFVDYAKASNVAIADSTVEIAGAGALARFELPENPIDFEFIWAAPFDGEEDFGGATREASDQRLWFSISAEF